MATKELTLPAKTLTSSWTVNSDFLYIISGPTTATGTFTFDVSGNLPSRAKVTNLSFTCYVGATPGGGTVNVGGVKRKASSTISPITPTMTNGKCSISCSYTAAGSTSSGGDHSASVAIGLPKLKVTYTVSSGSSNTDTNPSQDQESNETEGTQFNPGPLQPCYIYDKEIKKYYVFDGVIKVAHSMTLKIEEKSSGSGSEVAVNNAKNEPNKVVLDVAMSNVYTSKTDLTKKHKARTVSAVLVLNELKTSRRKVDVVTDLITYKDMLLAGIAITEDESNQAGFSWQGQLTFQEAYKPKPQSNTGNPSGSEGTTETPSGAFSIMY